MMNLETRPGPSQTGQPEGLSEWVRLALVVVFSRKRAVVWVFVFTVLLTTAFCFLLTPQYSGTFSILVKGGDVDATVLIPGVPVQARQSYVTPAMVADEQRILESNALAQRVLEKLRERHGKVSLDSGNPPIPEWLRRLVRSARDRWKTAGQDLDLTGAPVKSKQGDRQVGQLKKLLVVAPVVKTDVIEVAFEHPDPSFVQELLVEVLDTYLNQRTEIWLTSRAPDFFRKQAASYWDEWADQEKGLNRVREDPALVIPAEEKAALTQQAANMEAEASRLEVDQKELEQRLARVKSIGLAEVKTFKLNDAAVDPLLAELRTAMSRLEAERASLLRNFTQGGPVEGVDREIAVLAARYRDTVREYLQSELTRVSERRTILADQVETLKKKLVESQAAEAKLNILQERTSITRDYVRAYERKSQETRIENELKKSMLPNVGVLSPPYVRAGAVFPNKGLLIPASIVLGLVLGILVAIVLELFDDSFKLPEQVSRSLGIPVLASLPLDPTQRTGRRGPARPLIGPAPRPNRRQARLGS